MRCCCTPPGRRLHRVHPPGQRRESWRVVQPLLDLPPPVHPYEPGTGDPTRPEAASAAIGTWHRGPGCRPVASRLRESRASARRQSGRGVKRHVRRAGSPSRAARRARREGGAAGDAELGRDAGGAPNAGAQLDHDVGLAREARQHIPQVADHLAGSAAASSRNRSAASAMQLAASAFASACSHSSSVGSKRSTS